MDRSTDPTGLGTDTIGMFLKFGVSFGLFIAFFRIFWTSSLWCWTIVQRWQDTDGGGKEEAAGLRRAWDILCTQTVTG